MRLDLLSFSDLLTGKIWKHDGTYIFKATFVYKVLNNSAAPTLEDSFLSRSILVNNYNLRLSNRSGPFKAKKRIS